MALFRKNKTDQAGMPAEVTDYYQAEKRERAWVAWLLAFATLLVTVLVVWGIFFGGRWTFRKLKDSDKPAPVAIQKDESKDVTPEESGSSSQATNAPAESGNTSSSSTQSSSSGSTSQTSNSSPGSTSTSSSATSQTNAAASDLPQTGPGDTLAIFVAVSVLAYITHRKFLAN